MCDCPSHDLLCISVSFNRGNSQTDQTAHMPHNILYSSAVSVFACRVLYEDYRGGNTTKRYMYTENDRFYYDFLVKKTLF